MPIITQPVKRKLYRGFSTRGNPFGKWRMTDLEILKQDLINHFYIKKGEKLMNPNFGSNIPLMVMEQLDETTRQAILSDVKDVIASDPRLVASSVDIRDFEQGIQISIEMVYPEYDLSGLVNLEFSST